MRSLHEIRPIFIKSRPSRWLIVLAAIFLVGSSISLFYFIIIGKTRAPGKKISDTTKPLTGELTETLVPRRLDGVFVPSGTEAFAPRAIMVDNHTDARPVAGVAKADVVIEAPVEGGVTRFMLLFDPSTQLDEVGAVRSARPYFVDWAAGWRAAFFHCGGSPEALGRLKSLDGNQVANVDEIARGNRFWRNNARLAPHNIYTKKEFMDEAVASANWTSSTLPVAWRFKDSASSTDRGNNGLLRISYAGNYAVAWQYEKEGNIYVRQQKKRTQLDKNDLRVEAANVIVLKTDAAVSDAVGRLRLRTTGGGDAFLYRDGKKFIVRWQRAPNEPIRFAGKDGSEVVLNRGKTWIEVTTDDRAFAGL